MALKICLVVGGTGGLGRAIAEHLAIRNYTVVIAGRNATIGTDIVSRIRSAGGRACFLSCDLSSAISIKELHSKVHSLYNRLDVAINAAGIALQPAAKLADVDLSGFKMVMDINVTAVFLCMQEQLRTMLEQGNSQVGRIINLASIYSSAGAPFGAAYCTSKHAVVGLTKTAALEYAPQGIAINAVAPGAVPTAMTETALDSAGKLGDQDFGKIGEEMVKQYPMGRYGSAEEVAKAVTYLIESDWTTGTVLTVDGGWSAGTSMNHALL
ncbi:Putative short-chain dehydrogenase/reductase SDR, NAD(P)-binding domain superfamily [Septoria linicola]|uniref:Short-chain dehydrogenase/reductase SDR, NAD(P)-binding domain superfamily n=1 Tax=Septoria linicola TaxID=215465 RepID=A0A9Q9ARC2_9PEZI|nr:putative short-chain dehydrogenase/reductase SDR, NAD(P)-binding domain superfamily [Septoria linicola]USW53139.1 Putative short-chain dehydrogenase/reductase SDR, NAD(P)-binding domain superfamily [Septoria linicola]